jgi:hypothetical protein
MSQQKQKPIESGMRRGSCLPSRIWNNEQPSARAELELGRDLLDQRLPNFGRAGDKRVKLGSPQSNLPYDTASLGRRAKRLVNADEVVPERIERDHVRMVFEFL